jgi:hypothetical protein
MLFILAVLLKTLAMTRNGKLPRVADGYDPYIAKIKQALEHPPTLSGWVLMIVYRCSRHHQKSADEKTEGHLESSLSESTCVAGNF